MAVFVTVSLYKNSGMDPTYKHLKKSFTKSPSYTMENASIVKIGQKQAIRFNTNNISYYDMLSVDYLKIDDNEGHVFYAFVDNVEYNNPGVSSVYYTVDYWQTFAVNSDLGTAYIERSGVYDETDPIKAPDGALPSGNPSVLRSTMPIIPSMDAKIIVYYKTAGTSSSVALNKFNDILTKTNAKNSVSYTLKDQGERADTNISGSFDTYETALKNAGYNFTQNSNIKSKIKYKVYDYSENAAVSMFNDPDLWNADGTNIIKAEIRPGFGSPDKDGLYTQTFDLTSNDVKIKDFLHKNPFIVYKIQSTFGGFSLDPSYKGANEYTVSYVDSVLPGAHPIIEMNGFADKSRVNDYTLIDTQDRTIDLFQDKLFGKYFTQRNRLNAQIANFVRSQDAKIKSLYVNFNLKMLQQQQSNAAQVAGFDNSKFSAVTTLNNSNNTQITNLKQNQDTQTANIKDSQNTQTSNTTDSQKQAVANLQRSNTASLNVLDNNQQLSLMNIDNNFNTQSTDIDISFDTDMTKTILSTLGASIGDNLAAALNTAITGVLTGGLSKASSDAKLKNSSYGDGKESNTNKGSYAQTKNTNENAKTNLNLNQQAAISNQNDMQEVQLNNLKRSQSTELSNLSRSQQTAKTVLTNSQNLSKQNLNVSKDAEQASLTNSLNLAVTNLYNNMQQSVNSAIISLRAEAENFMQSLEAELDDYKGTSTTVSSGTGFNYYSLGLYKIYLNIYSCTDSVIKQAENYAEKFGIKIGLNKNLSDIINATPQLKSNGEFFVKTDGLRAKFEGPQQAQNIISDAFNNGLWIQA